uniref:Uncharacterized protein n=1 Tax=Arundo donax TaxID=35708 RepID=A0A0A9DPL8_ARUDO
MSPHQLPTLFSSSDQTTFLQLPNPLYYKNRSTPSYIPPHPISPYAGPYPLPPSKHRTSALCRTTMQQHLYTLSHLAPPLLQPFHPTASLQSPGHQEHSSHGQESHM